jgi:SAM-dependent methyltransferase
MPKFEQYTKQELMSRKIGPETAKSFEYKIDNDFWFKYANGENILEVGYDGGLECVPIFPHATGVDLKYPGYDGVHLPFEDSSQDTVYASHIFEHVDDWKTTLQEWFRVLRVGGFLIVIVPHMWLYEKQPRGLSRWNSQHRRFYTPEKLLFQIYQALPPGSFRLRHCVDNDQDWYDNWHPTPLEKQDPHVPAPEQYGLLAHSEGCYEIEVVLEKTAVPEWFQYYFK